MNNPLLNMISISKRAGKLVMGFDLCKKTVFDCKAELVLMASDLSPRTVKAVENICKECETPYRRIPITLSQLEWTIGKRAGVLAITDHGLANKIAALADRQNEEECIL